MVASAAACSGLVAHMYAVYGVGVHRHTHIHLRIQAATDCSGLHLTVILTVFVEACTAVAATHNNSM